MNEPKKKILVAEDDETLAETLAERITAEGFEVIKALDGEEALHYFWKEKPDVVLLDIIMPRKDGLNVIKDIRKQDPENKTPIIILTNSKDSQYLASALSHQVTSYLVKADHSLDDIVQKIREQLSQ